MTSLVVQWLRLQAPNAGGVGSIPNQENLPQMPKNPMATKIPYAATKTQHSQINKFLKIK